MEDKRLIGRWADGTRSGVVFDIGPAGSEKRQFADEEISWV